MSTPGSNDSSMDVTRQKLAAAAAVDSSSGADVKETLTKHNASPSGGSPGSDPSVPLPSVRTPTGDPRVGVFTYSEEKSMQHVRSVHSVIRCSCSSQLSHGVTFPQMHEKYLAHHRSGSQDDEPGSPAGALGSSRTGSRSRSRAGSAVSASGLAGTFHPMSEISQNQNHVATTSNGLKFPAMENLQDQLNHLQLPQISPEDESEFKIESHPPGTSCMYC